MDEYTIRELMAVLLARELRDGEVVVAGGVRSAVPMAAVFLAQNLRCPNIQLVMGMGVVNPRPDRIWPSAGDYRYAADCEGFVSMDEIFELSEIGRFDVAFYGGLQIDRFGNANLTWVDAGDRRNPGARRCELHASRHGRTDNPLFRTPCSEGLRSPGLVQHDSWAHGWWPAGWDGRGPGGLHHTTRGIRFSCARPVHGRALGTSRRLTRGSATGHRLRAELAS